MVEAIMILICALWIGGYLFTLGAMVSIGDKHELACFPWWLAYLG